MWQTSTTKTKTKNWPWAFHETCRRWRPCLLSPFPALSWSLSAVHAACTYDAAASPSPPPTHTYVHTPPSNHIINKSVNNSSNQLQAINTYKPLCQSLLRADGQVTNIDNHKAVTLKIELWRWVVVVINIYPPLCQSSAATCSIHIPSSAATKPASVG